MTHLRIFLISLLTSSLCVFLAAQANDKSEFYDFDFLLVGVNQDEIETYRFETFSRKHVTDNSWGFVHMNDSLQYTEAFFENGNLVRYDTVNLLLTEREMSEIYRLSLRNFEIGPNKTFYPIPPPPMPGGITTHLILDLNFRGGKYHKTIRNTLYGGHNESEFKDLMNWLGALLIRTRN